MVPEEDLEILKSRYQFRTNQELLVDARQYDEMTETAKAAIRQEFERRNLEPPIIYEWVPDEPRESRPAPAPGLEVSLVTVARYRDLSEAIVARSVLESAAIPCFLFDANFVRLDWGYSNFIGGMRLQVEAKDEAYALELLNQEQPESIEVPGTSAFVQPICPKCGSDDIVAYDSGLKLAAASALLVGIPTRLSSRTSDKERWHCMNCGCNWADDQA